MLLHFKLYPSLCKCLWHITQAICLHLDLSDFEIIRHYLIWKRYHFACFYISNLIHQLKGKSLTAKQANVHAYLASIPLVACLEIQTTMYLNRKMDLHAFHVLHLIYQFKKALDDWGRHTQTSHIYLTSKNPDYLSWKMNLLTCFYLRFKFYPLLWKSLWWLNKP